VALIGLLMRLFGRAPSRARAAAPAE
jgi:hypothetical protein